MIVMAGDIGGTKTNLGLFKKGKTRPSPRVIKTYPSRDAKDLTELIAKFIQRHPARIHGACFGVAGPIINGRCKATNLPWVVSEDRIQRRFKWPHVRLINDLTATAKAINFMHSRELFPLNHARIRKRQNMALVAPGTGLGQALLIFQNGTHWPIASEGGHADFAPNNENEIKLWQHLHRRYGHVSVERVLSGPGLVNIYDTLKKMENYREPEWLAAKMKNMTPARVITETALAKKNSLCIKSLKMFVSIFGAVAGNLALTGMATGGVYLGGGISPKILPKVKTKDFMQSFTNKGALKNLLEKIAVRVILNDKAALIGAASCAFHLADRR